jgi:hypothetical protein
MDDLGALLDALRAQMLAADKDILTHHPLEKYLEPGEAVPRHRGYGWISNATRDSSQDIARRTSPSTLGKYHKLLLLHLVASFETRVARQPIPASVVGLLREEIGRIQREARDQPDDFYHFSNDLFLKDLGLCRFLLLPCGAELLEVGAGVPRRLLWRGGATQLLRGLYFFSVRTRGFRPFYSLHLDPRRLQDFSPEGWDRSYLRIAELLALNPDVKGVFGSAWFYDPRIETISPRLAYLRARRVEHGAWGFGYGSNPASLRDALARSDTRRRLYEAGEYVPIAYYLVWPRADLLRWAERARHADRPSG